MIQIQRNNPIHAYLVIKSAKRMLILISINLIKVSVPDQENKPSFICGFRFYLFFHDFPIWFLICSEGLVFSILFHFNAFFLLCGTRILRQLVFCMSLLRGLYYNQCRLNAWAHWEVPRVSHELRGPMLIYVCCVGMFFNV